MGSGGNKGQCKNATNESPLKSGCAIRQQYSNGPNTFRTCLELNPSFIISKRSNLSISLEVDRPVRKVGTHPRHAEK